MSDLSWQQAALGFAAEEWCSSKDQLFDYLRKVHASPPKRKEFRDWASRSVVLPGLLKPFDSDGADPADGLSSAVEPGEVAVVRCDFSHLDHLYVYPAGDIHKGSAVHQAERWHQWLAYLTDTDNVAMLNTGDNLNCAIVGSKSDVYDEATSVSEAKWELIEELRPLAEAGKLLNIGRGNHEDRVWRATGDDPTLDIARVLNVPFVRESALFVIKVGSIEYEIFYRHGTGNGQSLAQLEKAQAVIDADAYITGHTHKQAITATDRFYRQGDSVVRRHRYFVASGPFLGYEGYAAARGYQPSRIGCPRVFLNGERHEIHASI